MPLNDKYFLNPAHLEIARARYFLKGNNNELIEHDIEDVFQRETDFIYQNDPDHKEKALQFRKDKMLMPAGRPLAQAGTGVPNLANCFCIDFAADTKEAISELKRIHFKLSAMGAGIGINYSTLRPEGSPCTTSLAISSGAVGFITDISYQASNVMQGGQRSGAGLAILEDWHPDLLDFIHHKSQHNWENVRKFADISNEDEFFYFQWNNHHHWQMFNVSVAVSDQFMEQVLSNSDEPWKLHWKGTEWPLWDFENPVGPKTGKEHRKSITVTAVDEEMATSKASSKIPFFNSKMMKLVRGPYHLSAKEWFRKIAENAHEDGCPGIIFLDVIKRFHNGEYFNNIRGLNPCHVASSYVFSTTGLTQFKDLKVGNIIWSGSKWTIVTDKWSSGIKPTYRYQTRAGYFEGTSDHKILQKGDKVEVGKAKSIDICPGPTPTWTPQEDLVAMIDGLLIGDGTVKRYDKNQYVYLIIGKDDHCYFNHKINLLLDNNPAAHENDVFYCKVKESTLDPDEIPRTYLRKIPERYIKADLARKLSFLKGLYSANGTVLEKHSRIALKASSFNVIQDVQVMLSSVGIRSYYTISKPTKVQFSNGTYECKQSYDLNISADRNKFKDLIGFIHPYKMKSLEVICQNPIKSSHKTSYDIKEIEYLGEQEVFDITVDDPSHAFWCNGLHVSNCGEVALPANGVCSLTSIVLPTFFQGGEFNWDQLREVVTEGIRGLDNMTDLTHTTEKDIDANIINERRIGLGTTGIAELLLLEGIRYDSQEGRDYAAKVLEFIRDTAYRASIELAKERGPFPAFKYEGFSQSEFFKTLPSDIQEGIKEFGIRNVTLLVSAPVGTTGTILGVSQGCEPYFALQFQRNSRVGSYVDGSPCFNKWLKEKGISYSDYNFSLEQMREKRDDVPDFFIEAHEVSSLDHLKMQAVFAKYIDASISKTINCPNNTTIEEVEDIFKEAYKLGIKSTTIYRDGSKQQILEKLSKKDEKVNRPNSINEHQAPKRPRELKCDIHHTSIKGEKWTVLVGLFNEKPYEVFCAPQESFELGPKYKEGKLTRIKSGKYDLDLGDFKLKNIATMIETDEHRTITRLLSTCLRHGVPTKFINSQLNASGGTVADFSKAVGRILKRYQKDEQEEVVELVCGSCQSTNIKKINGCPQCLDCGWSKCD